MSYKPKEKYASSNNTDNYQAERSKSLNWDYLFQAKDITDIDEKHFSRVCEVKVQLW